MHVFFLFLTNFLEQDTLSTEKTLLFWKHSLMCAFDLRSSSLFRLPVWQVYVHAGQLTSDHWVTIYSDSKQQAVWVLWSPSAVLNIMA